MCIEKRVKYFLDTEFIEYPNTIQLISIGFVADDGREYYAISSEYDYNVASDWVKDNVIEPIYKETYRNVEIDVFHKYCGIPNYIIADEIKNFVGYPDYKNGKPEFWGYFADYDWVSFCWLFGAMIDLPEGFPMYCNDLIQVLKQYNLPKLPKPEGEHNALVEAKWNKILYDYIQKWLNEKGIS